MSVYFDPTSKTGIDSNHSSSALANANTALVAATPAPFNATKSFSATSSNQSNSSSSASSSSSSSSSSNSSSSSSSKSSSDTSTDQSKKTNVQTTTLLKLPQEIQAMLPFSWNLAQGINEPVDETGLTPLLWALEGGRNYRNAVAWALFQFDDLDLNKSNINNSKAPLSMFFQGANILGMFRAFLMRGADPRRPHSYVGNHPDYTLLSRLIGETNIQGFTVRDYDLNSTYYQACANLLEYIYWHVAPIIARPDNIVVNNHNDVTDLRTQLATILPAFSHVLFNIVFSYIGVPEDINNFSIRPCIARPDDIVVNHDDDITDLRTQLAINTPTCPYELFNIIFSYIGVPEDINNFSIRPLSPQEKKFVFTAGKHFLEQSFAADEKARKDRLESQGNNDVSIAVAVQANSQGSSATTQTSHSTQESHAVVVQNMRTDIAQLKDTIRIQNEVIGGLVKEMSDMRKVLSQYTGVAFNDVASEAKEKRNASGNTSGNFLGWQHSSESLSNSQQPPMHSPIKPIKPMPNSFCSLM